MGREEIKMGVGEKIRKLRESKIVNGKKLSMRKLAEMANISPSFLSDIERGITEPSLDTLRKIASALECTPGELLDDVVKKSGRPPIDEENQCTPPVKIYSDIIMVPLLSEVSKACCGEGNGYEFPDETIERMIPLFLDAVGPIRTKGLFAVRVEGDSMTGAKIYDGDIVVVAPEEEPMNGNVVFVCYGPQKKWMIRWYYTKPNGTIILKAANREYPEIEVTQEDIEMGWYTYVGKVVAVQGMPRNGI